MVRVVENVEGTYKSITIPFNLRDKQSRLVRDANGKLCTEKREEEWLISFGFAVPDMRKFYKYVHAKKTNPDGLHTKLSNTHPGLYGNKWVTVNAIKRYEYVIEEYGDLFHPVTMKNIPKSLDS
jgi:hypothetical protein